MSGSITEEQKNAYINSNLNEVQLNARNKRNAAIAIALLAWVVLVFAATIARLGENALQGAPM